ncbi:ATP-binding protein [Cognatilysobacter bugurensis]|uniref:ATP-binding protein n=1 Tax=Cognatilysobacter bugurensis TaxID=543356 RepID=UPI001E604CCA|nr:ATP-binding protein [Lysobacter bugurensis]
MSGVAVAVVSGWAGVRNYRHLQQQSAATVASQAEIVATYSSAAFAFGDRELARETLEALRAVQGLQRAYLIDRHGGLLAAFDPSGEPAPLPKNYRAGRWSVPGGFVLVMPVHDRAGLHGRLQIEVRDTALRREALMGALQTALLSLLAMLFAVWIGRRLQPLLTEPIVRLERAAQHVRDTGDYSTRVPVQDDDELGRLSAAFNEMLRHIERQQEALLAAQLRAEESKEQLELATEAADIGLWDVDLVANTLFWPPRVKAMFGIAAERPVTMDDFYQGLHPEDRESVTAAFASAADPVRRAVYDVDYRTVGRDDGVIRWVAAKGRAVFDANGRCVRVIGTAIDVTTRKANERALRESEERLRDADRRKDEFLAMLAHELRNPLAPIATASALLEHLSHDPGKVRSASQVIGRQVRHMSSLVDDLLDVSRVTRGLIDIERANVELRDVVHAALEQARPLMDTRGHTLTVDTPHSEVWVAGDRTRLIQSVANLLNNAAKYTPAGGKVAIALRPEQMSATISVEDSGIGMNSALLPRVFDLFVQGERTPDRSQGGLGIGLALVHALVTRHGGTIVASSAGLGQGSCFAMTLPTIVPRTGTPHPMPALALNQLQRRVLVVDDNVDAADSLVQWLSVMGHDVHVAYDGAHALALATGQTFDMYILDIGLPDMTGIELLSQLRLNTATDDALFVAATGYGQAEDRAATMAAGFHHHLVKPLDPSVLAVIIEQFGGAAVVAP